MMDVPRTARLSLLLEDNDNNFTEFHTVPHQYLVHCHRFLHRRALLLPHIHLLMFNLSTSYGSSVVYHFLKVQFGDLHHDQRRNRGHVVSQVEQISQITLHVAESEPLHAVRLGVGDTIVLLLVPTDEYNFKSSRAAPLVWLPRVLEDPNKVRRELVAGPTP